jgi:hypothetical protein
MGGFFSKPSAPPAPPPPPPAADPEAEARKLRLDNMARNRRGRAGMIGTSTRGALDPAHAANPDAGQAKRLLGE